MLDWTQILWSIVDCLQTYNGAVTAVATIFIGVFTLVLALVTRRQAKLTRDGIALARREFNATHRPHIVVRDIVKDRGSIFYLIVNKGDAPATIVESWITHEVVRHETVFRPLRSFGHDDLGRLFFAVGEMKDRTYLIPDETIMGVTGQEMKTATGFWAKSRGEFHFTGTILYEDSAGQRRRTVFRRRWDPQGQGFRRLDDPDQEYSD